MDKFFKEMFEGFHKAQTLAIDAAKSEKAYMEERAKEKKSQTSEVKKHLIEHKRITRKQAFELYGCTRLSSMILRLRRQGWNIETIPTDGKDRYKTPTNFATYALISQPKNK